MIKGEVTARPHVFAAAVKWAAKFLDARPTVPVQGGLLLDVSDGSLSITAMNENVSAVAWMAVEGMGEGRAVVSGRLLNELVGTFPDRAVVISGDDEESIVLVAGRWTGTLPTMNAEDYPAQPDAPEAIGTVSGDDFARVIAEAAAATSKDSDKQVQWRALHLQFGDGSVGVIGTDSYRMAGAVAAFRMSGDVPEIELGATALVLAQPMVDVAASFIGPDEVTIGLRGSAVSMESQTRSVVLRRVEVNGGTYPIDVVTTLLAKEQPHHAVVKVANLAGPLKRAALVRDKDGPVAIEFSDGAISIAAKAEQLKTQGAESVDADYSGPTVVLHFNPKYFGEALATAPGDEVDIALTDEVGKGGRPGEVVLSVPGSTWRHVLMPIVAR